MPDYVIAYHGISKPASPEEGQAQMQDWQKWVENLGDAVVNPGTPLTGSTMVGVDGPIEADNKDKLTGFSTVSAPDMEAAIKIAQDCPFCKVGYVQVAQVMQMG